MNKAEIFYKDIGDYLSREEKLKIVSEDRSILNPALKMIRLEPNEHGDWISQRNSVFGEFIPLEPEQKFDVISHSFFTVYSLGIATNKDAWLYNFSSNNLEKNIKKMIDYYNNQRIVYHKLSESKRISTKKWVTYDEKKITWTDMFLKDLEKNIRYKLDNDKVCVSLYRPFKKTSFYYEKQLIQRTYQQTKLFLEKDD
jgi:predicted helicase